MNEEGSGGEVGLFFSVLTETHYWQEAGSVEQVPLVCYHGQHLLKALDQKRAHSHACRELLLGFAAKSKHNLTEANLFLPVFLPPALCGCVWDVVSGLKPIPLPWACVPTHTPGASTHTPGAHTRTADTDAVNWTLRAQRIPVERSLAQLEPEDVNRGRATASGQTQQRQTGLQEER